MPRLAWFSPLPPAQSGIAAYSAELLPHLVTTHEIDVFVDHGSEPWAVGRGQSGAGPDAGSCRKGATAAPAADGPSSPISCPPTAHGPLPVSSAHDFVWRHLTRPYDLVVYQLGNAACHDYMWPYLLRYPGFVVLHDGGLHHARARWLLRSGRADDYRAEFAFNHPGVDPDLAELAVAGFESPLYYWWPMTRALTHSARLLAVHSGRVADDLRDESPGIPVDVLRMGVTGDRLAGDPEAAAAARREVRARHGVPADAIVFAAVGLVTPEKRISQALAALRLLGESEPGTHLLLVGASVDHFDSVAEARALGLGPRVTTTGYVPDALLPAYLAAADACLCLRWPTTGETSASWLRCLAAGRPTIVTDLAHTADVPSLDPRTWTSLDGGPAPVAIAIDLLDEEHSLKLAMRRLATDARLREQLGRASLACWQAGHTIDCMAADYERAIARGLARRPPDAPALPRHLRPDPWLHTRRLLDRFEPLTTFKTLEHKGLP